MIPLETTTLKNGVRNHIQFLVTIQIFFVAVLYSFYRSIDSSEVVANNVGNNWGVGVAFCILSYLLVSFLSEKNVKFFAWIQGLLAINLLAFIFPIIIVIVTANNSLEFNIQWVFTIVNWVFIASLYVSLYLPIIITVLITIMIFITLLTDRKIENL
ncbi:MAG: hypothetical protein COU06_00225 [Candidatus Harrisonbacteria bacterium CG10_big_fil_rev_8_21_14_0_10_38_8]|uniref:Uncharacterized protein n=1 Tax=Candidatus Harrisonbacteria bacterium CG10_big_fil_rev_8_21_14_0_10_38_8 TaxID=1974582 RepID=A0A2M6WKX8_9BACT|nr:MAG: hypothetical protein COU06_00225 [Candidatus Harrisonbacteria bacterium CG10_big_fil_rev_8_21_14_0_10_38_8]